MDDVWRIHLCVTVLVNLQVEHELDQHTMQLRQRTAHYRKSRTGHPGCGFHIQQAKSRADIDVIACFEGKLRWVAPTPDFHVARLVRSVRHGVVQQIGQPEQQTVEFVLYLGQRRLGCL